MSAVNSTMERSRYGLSDAILAELDSWPDLHRQVFTRSHYKGQSIEEVSRALGIYGHEVRTILQMCERKLRTALRSFRESCLDETPSVGIRAPKEAQGGYLF